MAENILVIIVRMYLLLKKSKKQSLLTKNNQASCFHINDVSKLGICDYTIETFDYIIHE